MPLDRIRFRLAYSSAFPYHVGLLHPVLYAGLSRRFDGVLRIPSLFRIPRGNPPRACLAQLMVRTVPQRPLGHSHVPVEATSCDHKVIIARGSMEVLQISPCFHTFMGDLKRPLVGAYHNTSPERLDYYPLRSRIGPTDAG